MSLVRPFSLLLASLAFAAPLVAQPAAVAEVPDVTSESIGDASVKTVTISSKRS